MKFWQRNCKSQWRISHNLNLSSNTKVTCIHVDIKLVDHHRQEYRHRYRNVRGKQLNILVDVDVEPRPRITIVVDITTKKDISTTILLAKPMIKHSKSVLRSKIWSPIPREFLYFTTPLLTSALLTSGTRSEIFSCKEGQKSVIIDDVISI
jgi:hypothetical protein